MLASGRMELAVMEVTKTTGRSGFGRGWGAGVWSCLRCLLETKQRYLGSWIWRTGPGWMYKLGVRRLMGFQAMGQEEIT